MFDDGTAGMSAIKQSGGLCIIQDPSEAQFPDMPRSVQNKINVDFIGSLAHIPKILDNILDQPLPPEKPIPRELRIEAEITENMTTEVDQMNKIADRSDFACPDCGGGLWAIKNDPSHRYRCHVGHVYTEELLDNLQDQKIEESIWVSIRMLEEKENLILLMSNRHDGNEDSERIEVYDSRLQEVRKHIKWLKSFLARLNGDLHYQ